MRPPELVPRVKGLLALTACAAFAASAGADDVPGSANIEAVPIHDLLDLPVRAVSLHEERLGETSAAAFVLTAEDIRLQGFRTLAEALGSVPGLFGYRDDYFPAIGVRGFGVLMDYGTRLLVLVNGHPLNDSVGLGGTLIGRDLPVPIDAVKRIEVVKGPVGSIYGPTAFLGVVNVVTLDPDDRASQVRASGEASQGRVLGGEGGFVSTTRVGELGLTAAAQGWGSRGHDYWIPELLIPLPGRPAPASAGVVGANGADAESVFARLAWDAFTLTGACGWSGSGQVSAAYGSIIGDRLTRAGTRNCYLDVAYTRPLGERLTLDLRGALDAADYHDVFPYPAPPADYGTTRDLGRDRWLSADARMTWRPSSGTLLLAGLTPQAHWTLQRVAADTLPTLQQDPVNGVYPGDIPKDYATLNGYLLVDRELTPTLRLDLGLTWYWHELFGHRITPKLAAVWSPTPDDTVKAVYSQGFRPPTASEAFYDDGTAYLRNPDLRPEVVDAFELILERRLGALSLTANAFLHRYTELIRYVTVPAPDAAAPDPQNPADFRQQPRNVGSLWLRGAELSASARWGRWFQGYGGLSIQGVGAASDVNFPRLTGNLAVSSRALWEPLALAVNLTGAARRHKDPANLPVSGADSVAPSLLMNAAATLDIPGAERLSLELSVRNLLGAAAPDPLPPDYAPVTELSQPPRTFRLALRYHLD